MPHALSWFEIPAKDLQRAKRFYEAILQATMIEPAGEMKMAFFPADWQQGEIGGSIVEGEGYVPSDTGTVVFLNGGEDLSKVLDRVVAEGGRVVMPKTAIPMEGGGYFAMFLDSEGNRVGLVSVG